MTDQAPELLPCPDCGKSPGTRVGPPALARCITDGCPGKLLGAKTIAEWNTLPTPAERPVPQVREALEQAKAFIVATHLAPAIQRFERVTVDEYRKAVIAKIDAALTARPSDAAMARPLPGELALIQIAMETLRHIATYTPVSRIQPVMIARDALKKIAALTFESEPVKVLAIPHEEAVLALLQRASEELWNRVDSDMGLVEDIDKALGRKRVVRVSLTVASERVSDQTKENK